MRWFGWFRRGKLAEEAEGAPVAMIGGRARKLGIPYVLPADLEEMNRLDFQHFLLRQTFKGNYAAPIGEPRNILDVGSGTGRWAREMAQLFPGAQVVGLDVNPPPADEAVETGTHEPLPPNYQFAPGNILEGLPFPDASFDFVHMRLLVLAIPHDRWPFVVSELMRVTRPGGWVESVEATQMKHGGPAMDMLMDWIAAVLARRSVIMDDAARVGEMMRGAGLVNVAATNVALPFGEYNDRTAKLLATDFFTGVKGFAGVVQGIATPEQFEQVVAAARATVALPQTGCVSPFYIAYGQRPW